MKLEGSQNRKLFSKLMHFYNNDKSSVVVSYLFQLKFVHIHDILVMDSAQALKSKLKSKLKMWAFVIGTDQMAPELKNHP